MDEFGPRDGFRCDLCPKGRIQGDGATDFGIPAPETPELFVFSYSIAGHYGDASENHAYQLSNGMPNGIAGLFNGQGKIPLF